MCILLANELVSSKYIPYGTHSSEGETQSVPTTCSLTAARKTPTQTHGDGATVAEKILLMEQVSSESPQTLRV